MARFKNNDYKKGDIEMMTDYLMRLYWLGVLLFPGVI
jgi:hypothetical protein